MASEYDDRISWVSWKPPMCSDQSKSEPHPYKWRPSREPCSRYPMLGDSCTDEWSKSKVRTTYRYGWALIKLNLSRWSTFVSWTVCLSVLLIQETSTISKIVAPSCIFDYVFQCIWLLFLQPHNSFFFGANSLIDFLDLLLDRIFSVDVDSVCLECFTCQYLELGIVGFMLVSLC